ncbi:MAG: Fe-S cluster assembly protein SufD [Gemmatimonadota bacterium]|nr:Fe-S cluster assembly protein SufD [Gemmatimonadota bacterium]
MVEVVADRVAPEQKKSGALDRGVVERLAGDDPEWLATRRMQALRIYEATPMPSTQLEEWRYTDLSRKLCLDKLHSPVAEALPDDPQAWPERLRSTMAEDHDAVGHLVLVDGSVVHTNIGAHLSSRGVVLTSLRRAATEHPTLLEKYLATQAIPPEDGKLQALNAMLWTDGVLLYVPPGVRLEHPVRVTRWYSETGAAFFSRTLIVADSASKLAYVDEALSDDFDQETLTSQAVEVFASDGAHVQYVSAQRIGRGAFCHAAQRILLGRDATLDMLNVSLGASTTRVDLNARLLGSGADSNLLGLYFGDGDQHFDHNTSQDHIAPAARSDLLYKGALDDSSRAVFRGVIRVAEGAQQTDAYQTNRNLILSDNARADALPKLEIHADDVKCSHGATVGQLDEESLFYLMSRGLTRAQAERLVVVGFLGMVLQRLPLGGVVEKVTRVIEEKLRLGAHA